ncbi:centrosomal protein of 112 kDa isoform X3 [Takifugu flavidus]|uniref:centrosomal protein of 112 kDa isoform X3 n=2 Tax=Takifugu flavidus TaxID=433684 RepID=UPI002544C142|nr:centrosomal protein of 112 kDa isoform X3 [Takifugu flavidus]
MSKHEEFNDRLDTEFDHFLLDMKPYVLKNPSKAERHQCALWIKKLCDPDTCAPGLLARKNRNMYARLLLHMLKRGLLELPFTVKPGPGPLKTLPTYMSIYFDEPLSARSLEQNDTDLPAWVTGELRDDTDDSLSAALLKDKLSSTPIAGHRRRKLFEERSPSKPSPIKSSPRRDTRTVDGGQRSDAALDDSDLEARLNSWNLGIENPRYLREKPTPLSPVFNSSFGRSSSASADERRAWDTRGEETDRKLKVLEERHQEEKLKMQQKRDAAIEKILDRKNSEIEEIKGTYRAKQKESEEVILKLEKKGGSACSPTVQVLLRESQVINESKDKQIAELKKMSEHSADSLRNEWEKKLHTAAAEMELEKFELQKKHSDDIQELLEDTNLRVAKMEAEYTSRSQATEQILSELKMKVKQQSVELEKNQVLQQKLTQEKAQLEVHVATLSAQLQEANRRNTILQKEKEQQREQHQQSVQKLLAKHEMDVSHVHQEHALSAAKASEVMEDFEIIVAQLKQQLLDSDLQRQHQVRDLEIKFQQEKEELRISWEKKVLALSSEAEREKKEAKIKTAKLEDTIRELESQLERAGESQRQQIQQADMALERLKKQVELSSEKAYAEMKLQMEKVAEDLNRSKSLREMQAKDFSEQLASLRQRYEQQMAEQRSQHEQERTRLQQQHSTEKDSLVQEHQRVVDSLEKQARATLQQHQQQSQEWRKCDTQRISTLEAELADSREELLSVRALHKRQLAEVSLHREEDRRRAQRDKEESLNRLRSDMESSRRDLERSHQQQKAAVQEKSNSRLMQMEEEYGQKLTKSTQLIVELQSSLGNAKEEAVRLKEATDQQLQDADAQWAEDRRKMADKADQAVKALQEKVESLQRRLHASEKKLFSKELESEEKATEVRRQYEEKIKGLMPAELQKELEDTITSLKAQVNFLQKRAAVLQEDLDACRGRRQSPQEVEDNRRFLRIYIPQVFH